jgi:hypothetical protein
VEDWVALRVTLAELRRQGFDFDAAWEVAWPRPALDSAADERRTLHPIWQRAYERVPATEAERAAVRLCELLAEGVSLREPGDPVAVREGPERRLRVTPFRWRDLKV